MKVLIIEDENTAVRRLKRLLTECDPAIEIIDCLDSIKGAVKWFQNNEAPDLVFLDIQLSDGVSFRIFDQVTIQVPIIFCTAYDQYALQAFKVNSVDYLLKPVEKEDLQQSLGKFENLKNQYKANASAVDVQELLKAFQEPKKETKGRFLAKVGKKFFFVPIEKVAYFYTEHKIVKIVTTEHKTYPIDHPLDELESLVSPETFFRVNRQYLISTHCIDNIENDYGQLMVKLNCPANAPAIAVSRDRAQTFKSWLSQ